MTNNFPMTLLAQLGDVTVFQTSAVANTVDAAANAIVTTAMATESADIDLAIQGSQQSSQVEQANYGALNLGLHVNDVAAKVLDNRMRLLAVINEQLTLQQRLPIKSLHWVNQVHGQQIYDIDAAPISMQPIDADALVSQQDGLGLAIMTADCVPIVLYQPATGQLAAIHAGWQGLACGVIKTTAERFTTNGQIVAWIGVSISQENYEVGRQVRDQLLAGCTANKLLPAAQINDFTALFSIPAETILAAEVDKLSANKKALDKVRLNLPKLAAYQLTAAGITVNSDTPNHCSYGDERYYSYRRQTHLQQPATGRMALIIVRSLPI